MSAAGARAAPLPPPDGTRAPTHADGASGLAAGLMLGEAAGAGAGEAHAKAAGDRDKPARAQARRRVRAGGSRRSRCGGGKFGRARGRRAARLSRPGGNRAVPRSCAPPPTRRARIRFARPPAAGAKAPPPIPVRARCGAAGDPVPRIGKGAPPERPSARAPPQVLRTNYIRCPA